MPKKKPTSAKKKSVPKKKQSSKQAKGKTKVTARSKTASSKKTAVKKKKTVVKKEKTVVKKKKTAPKKSRRAVKRASPRPAEIRSPEPSTLDPGFRAREPRLQRGMGTASAVQSGDLQGLSHIRSVDSESVEELVEEGQAYEAEVVSGVEDALDPDQGEVQTREVLANDVPEEYTDED